MMTDVLRVGGGPHDEGRRPVSAALCIVLILVALAVATPTWGACAWVLWFSSSPTAEWSPVDAFEGKADCERRAAREDTRVTGKKPPAFYMCLPDTLDPRGSKR